MQYAFTKAGQHPEKLLIGIMANAKTTLDIAIYSLTKVDIVNAILAAKHRGLIIRVITDAIQSGGAAEHAVLQQLIKAGIPVKINIHPGLMHIKMTIADQSVATTGSFNYSLHAATVNDEVLVVINDTALAQDWTKQFNHMWDDTVGFRGF